jgi:hypothetical protein
MVPNEFPHPFELYDFLKNSIIVESKPVELISEDRVAKKRFSRKNSYFLN